MNRDQVNKLMERYQTGNASEEELILIKYWIHKFKEDANGNLSEEELDATENETWESIKKNMVFKRVVPLYARIMSIAAAVAIIGTIAFYYILPSYQSHQSAINNTNDIKPGSDKAVLTLANGTKINLSDAKNGAVASQSGLEITKAVDGILVYKVVGSDNNQNPNEINTITTPKGGQYKIVLPDGTKVWLNAASSLSYRTSLKERGGERMINMSGEAYFEVTKDKNHPFVVTTRNQTVTVLGTHFNINAYKDEPVTKTTLIEGSVRVTPVSSSRIPPEPASGANTNDLKEVILKPNEQASLTKNNIQIKQVDTDETIAWKNGKFMFRNEPLEQIMNKISRWYNVDIVFEDKQLANQSFGGIIARSESISRVLETLEETGDIHFKIEGRTVTVKK